MWQKGLLATCHLAPTSCLSVGMVIIPGMPRPEPTLYEETDICRLFDLILVFLERVFGLSWGEWVTDDRPYLVPNE